MNPNRIWFYFRHGYAYYIASVLAPFNTIMLLIGFSDKLGISTDLLFIIIPIIIAGGIPSIILLGRTHYRKAYKSEVDVMSKSNQYNFKVIPGSKEDKVILPVLLEILDHFPETQNTKVLKGRIANLLEGKNA